MLPRTLDPILFYYEIGEKYIISSMDILADMIDMHLKVKMLIHKMTKIFDNLRVFSNGRINNDVWQCLMHFDMDILQTLRD